MGITFIYHALPPSGWARVFSIPVGGLRPWGRSGLNSSCCARIYTIYNNFFSVAVRLVSKRAPIGKESFKASVPLEYGWVRASYNDMGQR